MLEVSNFTKSYGDQTILAIDSLHFKPGVHLIKGDNGSGKTTFFKCLAGILPFRGQVSLDKVSLLESPIAYRYRVNFAEAEPFYPGFLTCKDLIRFIGKTKQASTDQQAWYTSKLGVDSFYEKACDTYSSGMMKKLSLVLAFLGDPKMVILDEPLITLDKQTRESLFALIRQKAETIFLLSSHQSIESDLLPINTTFVIHQKNLRVE